MIGQFPLASLVVMPICAGNVSQACGISRLTRSGTKPMALDRHAGVFMGGRRTSVITRLTQGQTRARLDDGGMQLLLQQLARRQLSQILSDVYP